VDLPAARITACIQEMELIGHYIIYGEQVGGSDAPQFRMDVNGQGAKRRRVQKFNNLNDLN